jgi:4'-phosphopantetheinyl transferase
LSLAWGEVHLWFADPVQIRDEYLLQAYAALLSQEELARMGRFRLAEHRHLFLVSHVLMRVTLSRYARVAPSAWRFTSNAYGRPEIAAMEGVPPLRFNLSHCADCVLFGVTLEADIGVDVESATRGAPDANVARHFLADHEYRDWLALAPGQRQARFFQYWTLKEAYQKARGLGLNLPNTQFAFLLDEDGGIAITFDPSLDDEPSDWSFWQFRPDSGQYAALAVRGRRKLRPRAVCRRGVPLLDEHIFSCEVIHQN